MLHFTWIKLKFLWFWEFYLKNGENHTYPLLLAVCQYIIMWFCRVIVPLRWQLWYIAKVCSCLELSYRCILIYYVGYNIFSSEVAEREPSPEAETAISVAETNNQKPAETINKQPVTYMSVKEVISSAKSIDIHTATVSSRNIVASFLFSLFKKIHFL